MTDAIVGYKNLIAQTNQFVQAFEALKLFSDRVGADTSLSTAFAAAAATTGRSDLSAANFDNFKRAVDVVTALLESTASQTTTNDVNTGGKAVLAFYQLL